MRSLCGFLLVSLLSAPGLAQTPTAAFAETSGARASFEQGMAAYQQGRYRAAIEHFKEADRLAPSARLSFNVARAYEQMNDGPNALAAYRDYLRRSPAAENADDTSIRIAELELELQKSGVQQLTVLSTPPGAMVIIDDVSRGVSPWTGELAPGSHQLLLRLRGHADASRSFELPARHAIDLVSALVPASPPSSSTTAAPPAAPRSDALAEAAGPRWWTWTAFGSSAALLLGAGALELSRRGLEQDAGRTDRDQIGTAQTYDAMTSRMTAARVLLGAGVLMGAVGGVSLYFDLRRSRFATAGTEPSLGLSCAPGECQARARGYW